MRLEIALLFSNLHILLGKPQRRVKTEQGINSVVSGNSIAYGIPEQGIYLDLSYGRKSVLLSLLGTAQGQVLVGFSKLRSAGWHPSRIASTISGTRKAHPRTLYIAEGGVKIPGLPAPDSKRNASPGVAEGLASHSPLLPRKWTDRLVRNQEKVRI